jgi:hypothetical protein
MEKPMAHWSEYYTQFTTEIFGRPVPTDLTQTMLHSVYPQDSVWFQKCMDALSKVEHEYAEELINEMKCKNMPGSFVEFGIFQGHWIQELFEMTERAGLSDREIWGFDSFKGLPAPNSDFDSNFWKEGMYAASRAEVENNINAADRPRIKLVEGYFSDSLKQPEAAALGPVAYARIDCDLYEATKDCLEFLTPRLVDGAIIVLDDWSHNIVHSQGRAFAEWVRTVPQFRFEFLCVGVWCHFYMRVWHK